MPRAAEQVEDGQKLHLREVLTFIDKHSSVFPDVSEVLCLALQQQPRHIVVIKEFAAAQITLVLFINAIKCRFPKYRAAA